MQTASQQDAWVMLCKQAGASEETSASYWLLLQAAHNAPHRAYHALDHIAECLASLRAITGDRPPLPAQLALWFHDAVYTPGYADNEKASMMLCESACIALGLDDQIRTAACQAILDTKHESTPTNEISALVVDADLSILGSEPTRYTRYTQQIRQEWKHIDQATFKAGRAAVLESFLERSSIFNTPRARELFGAPARTNIETELQSLRA